MTPAPLDRDAAQAKLRLMQELLDDLERLQPLDADRLRRERLVRYAVERILMQLVDLAVALNSQLSVARGGTAPRSYRESFGLLADAGVIDAGLAERLAPSVGLRNVLAHECTSTDLGVVAASVPLALQHYRDDVRQVADALHRS